MYNIADKVNKAIYGKKKDKPVVKKDNEDGSREEPIKELVGKKMVEKKIAEKPEKIEKKMTENETVENEIEEGDETAENEMTAEEEIEYFNKRYVELTEPMKDLKYFVCPTNPYISCATCANFVENTFDIILRFIANDIEFAPQTKYGECRIVPQVDPVSPYGHAVFPIVPDYLWCGNWKLYPRHFAEEQKQSSESDDENAENAE